MKKSSPVLLTVQTHRENSRTVQSRRPLYGIYKPRGIQSFDHWRLNLQVFYDTNTCFTELKTHTVITPYAFSHFSFFHSNSSITIFWKFHIKFFFKQTRQKTFVSSFNSFIFNAKKTESEKMRCGNRRKRDKKNYRGSTRDIRCIQGAERGRTPLNEGKRWEKEKEVVSPNFPRKTKTLRDSTGSHHFHRNHPHLVFFSVLYTSNSYVFPGFRSKKFLLSKERHRNLPLWEKVSLKSAAVRSKIPKNRNYVCLISTTGGRLGGLSG